MNENQKKAVTGTAIALGYFAWFVAKLVTVGVRTAKPSKRRRF